MIDTSMWLYHHHDKGTLRLFLLKEFGWMMPRDADKQFKICDQIVELLRTWS
jgi:hypothetical protein